MRRTHLVTVAHIVGIVLSTRADDSKPEPPAVPPTKATFLITGLHCPPCTKTLETSLKRQPGVRSIQVDWTTKDARIEFDESLLPAQRVSQLIGGTPHMMGARMRYGGWLALKIPAVTDDKSGAPAKTVLERIAGVKSVAIYPSQHAAGIQFAAEGKVRSDELIKALQNAGIEATNY